MTNVFFNMLNQRIGISLDSNQINAASHLDGPALVLAVPGAGKTTVLISRIAYLVLSKKIPESQILSITFSRASAIDMNKRFDRTYGEFNINAKFSTIHSFSYMVLRDYFYKNNLNYNLIESSRNISQNSILREVYKNKTNSYLSDDKLEELINSIGYVKNMMISPEEYKSQSIQNFSEIFSLYEEYKRENRLLDFDDMLTMTLEVLEKDKEILNKYQSRYKYIQVDEGQDTSNIQHRIVEKLAAPNNNIFIVADDDQSIYGFRGANPKYLLDFKKRFKNAVIYSMDTNYRSSKSIVNVSKYFISQNQDRYEKNLKPNSDKESNVLTKVFNNQEDQYDYILENISSNLSDNAILFRNNISLIPLIDILNRKGIDFSSKDLKFHFFNHWITSDIVAFFNLIINDSDKNAFEKIYYKMNAYISKKAMNFVMSNKSSESVFDILSDFNEMKAFQKKNIRNLGIKFKRMSKNKPFEIINYIENDLEYLDYLKKRAEFLGQSLDSTLVYLSTIKLLAGRTNSILDFLFRLENLKEIVKENSSTEGVFLSTIHSAKGLEFENVFLVDLINGEFPSSGSLDCERKGEKQYLEEERRVFYVGMTRAKENLHLLSFRDRGVNMVPPSDFLQYIKKKVTTDEQILRSGSAYDFSIGDFIHHKKFGNGKVVDLDDKSIVIDFNRGGTKLFSINLLVEKGLIFRV